MSTYWSPKPLRPPSANPIFEMVEPEIVVKGLSPMQRQRLADGTPLTRQGPTALRPADPELVLRPELTKGSLAEKLEEKNPKYGTPRQDPQEPLGIIKSYLEKSELSAEGRAKIKDSNFALEGGRYPIHDESHARNALARVSQHGTPEEKSKVRAAVAHKYPGIEVTSPKEATHKSIEMMQSAIEKLSKAVGIQYTPAKESATVSAETPKVPSNT